MTFRSLPAMRCLVLNASMEPLSVVTAQRGLLLLQRGRIEVLENATVMESTLREIASKPAVEVPAVARHLGKNHKRRLRHVAAVAPPPEEERVMEEGGETRAVFFRSEHLSIPVPSVVVLRHYQKNSEGAYAGNRAKPSVTGQNVLRRDNGQCQYCSAPAMSVDHVVPISRGGKNVWDNVVACCLSCNFRKSNKLLEELKGFTLKTTPRAPSMAQSRRSSMVAMAERYPQWAKFFGVKIES